MVVVLLLHESFIFYLFFIFKIHYLHYITVRSLQITYTTNNTIILYLQLKYIPLETYNYLDYYTLESLSQF